MKTMKKLMAVTLAVVMAMALAIPVFAVDTTETVKVTGLENGDSVKFIKIIEWSETAGWKYVDGLTAPEGKTLPAIETITGSIVNEEFVAGTISSEHAAILAQAAATLGGGTEKAAGANGEAIYENAPMGLYYAQVTPAKADYLYNTIFVGADFKSEGSNTIAADTSKVGDATTGVAKKEQITLQKDAVGTTDNIKYDHAVGDVIDFTITSKVPAYGSSYVNPQYSITDQISTSNLQFKTDGTFTVTVGSLSMEEGDTKDYTVSKTTSGFTVTLTSAGLAKVAATGEAQQITIQYQATLTATDGATVDQEKNTATVTFSNNPTDSTSVSKLEDKTRHYTFSIDAALFGESSYETSELVKIGIDKDGKEITKKTDYSNKTEHGALGNAIFGLYKTEAAANAGKTTDTKDNNANFVAQATSTDLGKLNFSGLDAGTYYLVELQAPEGWIKDSTPRQVTIEATYEEIPAGSYVDASGITVNYDAYKVLKEYTITVGGENGASSTYTITNDKATGTDADNHDVSATGVTQTEGVAGDNTTPLKNTQGTELPSTGGIGTKLFYTMGAVLVIGAGVVLVSRKRAGE